MLKSRSGARLLWSGEECHDVERYCCDEYIIFWSAVVELEACLVEGQKRTTTRKEARAAVISAMHLSHPADSQTENLVTNRSKNKIWGLL